MRLLVLEERRRRHEEITKAVVLDEGLRLARELNVPEFARRNRHDSWVARFCQRHKISELARPGTSLSDETRAQVYVKASL